MGDEREYSKHPKAIAARRKRAEMPPEEAKRQRAMAKRAKYLRQHGKGLRCTPEETAEALSKIHAFREGGMSYDMMAQESGLSRTPLNDIVRGKHRLLTRKSYNAIMAMEFVLPTKPRSFRHTARVSPLGTQRRLRALWADGWPTKTLAPMMNMTRANFMTLVFTQTSVHHATHAEVLALYEKLANVKPADHGVDNWAISTAKSWARKKGCAPSHCWDADSFDDPYAWPEWTGKCGTTAGYKIHMREDIPLCPNCINAKMIYRRYPCLAYRMGITEERNA